jgi:hypothetical protein
VDLADPRRARPAPPGQDPDRRSPPTLGEDDPARGADHPRTSTERFSPSPPNTRHTGQNTETIRCRPRPAARHHQTPTNPLPSR